MTRPIVKKVVVYKCPFITSKTTEWIWYWDVVGIKKSRGSSFYDSKQNCINTANRLASQLGVEVEFGNEK